jgi:Tol biopolymer transport system component
VSQLRGLWPYALVSTLVAIASVVAIVISTAAPTAVTPSTASPAPSAAPSASRQAITDLSPLGRLAYWRAEPNGDHLLWLANADNSRRRSVAKTTTPSTISKTRWTVDGSAVAYVDGGTRLIVVRVDGATTSYALTAAQRADQYRIVDHRFSPSGARVAATVQRFSNNQSDVYVASEGGWTRVTTVEDALVADWLDEEEVLVQTTGGVISAVRASGTNQFRPLTGLTASSPVIGGDGRIHFLAGRVTQFAGASETFVFAAAANVWSMTADGTDVRREATPPDQDSLRLDGTWPGGYLYHRGTNPAQLVIGSIPILLPSNAGLIERIAVSPDRRYAIGFAGTTVVRVDITPAGLAPNAVLLLGSIDAGDVWFPRSAPIARGNVTAGADVPAMRYGFALGGNVWTMGPDGVASVLRTAANNTQTQRRFTLPLPRWSPAGDKLLTVESLGSGASALQLIPVTIDRAGSATRLAALSSVLPAVSWSPDGSQIAAVVLPVSSSDPSILQSELTVRVVGVNGTIGQAIPGREVAWARTGLFVLTNGTIRASDRARDEQAIELWTGTQRRTVTTVARIIGDPRAAAPSATKGITAVGNITAAVDGTFAAARVVFLGTTATPFLVVIRASDGVATQYVLGDRIADEAWSPTQALIGYTNTLGGQGIPGTSSEAKPSAVIRNAASGAVVAEVEGRFAGWSPDGAWFYVATSGGLFTRPLAGGELVRVSSIGVPVSVTKP